MAQATHKHRTLMKSTGGIVGLILVVAIAIAVNVAVRKIAIRADLTEENLYTLSDGTRDVLGRLESPVTLMFFFSRSTPEMPAELKSFAHRVEDRLAEYELAAKGKIIVKKLDPEPDSDAEEWAEKYGVMGQPVGYMGPTVYMGLVATMGDREDVMPVVNPEQENALEYLVTRMILRVSDPAKPVVGVLSSLPVLGAGRSFFMPGQPRPEPWFAFREMRADYDVRQLNPDAPIAEDIDALILVHPKGLPPKTLYAIDQFLLRGGRLLVFMDSLCVTESESQPMPQLQFTSKASELGPLLRQWGVEFHGTKVVADLEAVTPLRTREGGVEESLVWLSLRAMHMNKKNALTAGMEVMLMPGAGSFTVSPTKGIDVSWLISSSEKSDQADAMAAQFGGDSIRRKFKSGLKRLNIALQLHGRFTTAYPAGEPREPEPDGEDGADKKEEKKDEPVKPGLKESLKPSSVILVGDVDMLFDYFCIDEVNVYGFRAHRPKNDNLAFFANAVDQVAGDEALVRIRTQGKTSRPFERVRELAREAQERHLEEATRLQEKYETAEKRLSELQAQKDKSQRVFLSEEQEKERQRWSLEVRKTRKELKQVRRKLREDIERLGAWVKALNILAVPVFVALAGIAFGTYRRFRTRKR